MSVMVPDVETSKDRMVELKKKVRMLGSGRPFLVEIQNTCLLPSDVIINEIQSKINSSENKLVGVRNMKVVGSEGWTLVQEGEAEKQNYDCEIIFSCAQNFAKNSNKSASSSKSIRTYKDHPLVRVIFQLYSDATKNYRIRNKRLQAKKVLQRLRDIKDVSDSLLLIQYWAAIDIGTNDL
uniref:tRNA pseudouridine(55) synthase n=1 Tax=Cucumis melo TaxID=3656 RepID=A0A9I9EEF6_CUCME